jgi:hypothetical protein
MMRPASIAFPSPSVVVSTAPRPIMLLPFHHHPAAVTTTSSSSSTAPSSSYANAFLLSTHSTAASLRPNEDKSLKFDFEPKIENDAVAQAQRKIQEMRTTDPRWKTVVCVHWLGGLCMKAEQCDFLHEIDPARMADCRAGNRCTDKMCPFKHTNPSDRQPCNN